MNRLDFIFSEKVKTPSDINEHMGVLKEYSSNCNVVVELGVRSIFSTWAFLSGRPNYLYSYDIIHPSETGGDLTIVYDIAKEESVNFEFRLEDVLKADIPECDLLFIDTWHTYDQLTEEFKLHSGKVRKYIILHDTVSYAEQNEPMHHSNSFNHNLLTNKTGLRLAVDEFLERDMSWRIEKVFTHNNGLTILSKVK
jgi:hypothetical protein